MKRQRKSYAKPCMTGRDTRSTRFGISQVVAVDALVKRLANDDDLYGDLIALSDEFISNKRSVRESAARALIEIVVPSPGAAFSGSEMGKAMKPMWTTVMWSKGSSAVTK